jgi:hypothetical protein
MTHPPHITAQLDQARAQIVDELAALDHMVAQHLTTGCDHPGICVGPDATRWLRSHPHRLLSLLATTLASRAVHTTNQTQEG